MKISKETNIKLDELTSKYENDCRNIIKSDAENNNEYKVGDIVEDHYKIGKILGFTIQVSIISKSYDILYKVDRLTKSLKPYRGGEVDSIYLSNIERKLN